MFEAFEARTLEQFGGLNTLSMNTLDVPSGQSSNLLNMDFIGENAYTRDGLSSVATLSGKIIGIKEYVLLDPSQRRVLTLSDTGILSKESGNYAFSTISADIAEASVQATMRFRSQTLFGREYMAFSQKGTQGSGIPLYYDDSTLQRVGCDPPGAAPTVSNSATAGVVDAGTHQVRVFARTASGYWTALSPAYQFTATGGFSALVTNIPTGPSNWIARVICMAPVGDLTNFYFVEGTSMVLYDNVTTTTTISVNDSTLIAGTAVASTIDVSVDQSRQINLPAQANVIAYNRRLAWTGERNVLLLNGDQGLLNLGFLGGTWPGNPAAPAGWRQLVAGEAVVSGITGAPGTVLRVTGNGGSQVGVLENQGSVAEVIPGGVAINCRVRAKRVSGGGGPISGTFHIWFTDTNNPSTTPDPTTALQINMSNLSTTEWRIIDGQMTTGFTPVVTTAMRMGSGDGTVGAVLRNGDQILINYIEPYLASQPYSPSLVRWSKVDDPEAYDGLTGIMNVSENDGQRINAMFQLRGNLYFLKDHSMYSTQDNGQTEPDEWSVSPVSDTVGCLSPNGVATASSWALICARAGLHYFSGTEPSNISNQIKTTWKRINWLYGYKIWIQLDVEEKRFAIGVPLDANTEISHIIYCRYSGDSPSGFSTYGTVASEGVNWSLWTCISPSACFSERSDGTRAWLEGSTSGRVGKRDPNVKTDFGEPYTSYYQTYFFGDTTNNQLLGYVTANVFGQRSIRADLYPPDELNVVNLGVEPITTDSFVTDLEFIAQVNMARGALRLTSVGSGAWFQVNKAAMYMRLHPYISIRGTPIQ